MSKLRNSVNTINANRLSSAHSEIRFPSAQTSQEDITKLVDAAKNSPNVAEAYKELL